MIRKLLMVCTGNLCRSPMAAELMKARLKAIGREDIEVSSAGLAACVGEPPPPPVVVRMKARGLDVSKHRARQFTPELGNDSDLILVMESAQKRSLENYWPNYRGRVRRLGEWRGQDVTDPYGQSEEVYDACLASLEGCLNDWDERLFA